MKSAIALLFAAASLWLPGCAPTKPVPPPRAIPAPAQTAAVSPLADLAQDDAAKTSVVSARLESKIESLKRNAADLSAQMSAATEEAARLRQQKSATENELDGLWKLLTASEDHARRLFAEVEAAKRIADEQRSFRLIAEKRLDELAKAALARDTETTELRAQRDHFASELDHANTVTIPNLTDQLHKAEMKGAVGSYLKGIVCFLGILIVLFIAVRLLAFFKPL